MEKVMSQTITTLYDEAQILEERARILREAAVILSREVAAQKTWEETGSKVQPLSQPKRAL